MNKEHFLQKLKNSLSDLAQNDIEEIIAYYDELISDAIENKKDEEEFISELGDVEDISKKIKFERVIKDVNEKPTMKNKVSAVYSILGIITSPIWLPLGITLILVAIVLIICGFIIVASMAISVIALFFGLIQSFTYIAISPAIFSVQFLIIGAITFLIGLTIATYNFLYNTVTLGAINLFNKIILKKGGNKNV